MMSGTNKLPAPRTTSPVRCRQAAFSHSNGRKTAVEDSYGDSQTRASSLSQSAENPFVTFDGDFTAPSTPWSGSSPESNPGSVPTSESDPDPEQEVSSFNPSRGQPQFRDFFELDSNEPATAEAVYGENGRHEASARVIASNGDDDEPVMRRRPASPLLQPRRVAMERAGAKSTVNSSGNLKSVSFNDFPQSEWFGTSGPGRHHGVQERGREGLQFTERLNEVKSSSRKYEPWPTFENKKRCREILDKICPWKVCCQIEPL
ncbi:hypothetical protein F5Y13DRAFT_171409 [Hypoxylon sp. FL1857]|nr:hypothetical protein F5Y13DRAFT_171409 [Hypoxylon sp. FL1857]